MGAAVLVALSLAGALAPEAGATTTTINFDSFTAGEALGTEGDATFVGSPKVFVPAHVATHTPPNALHPQQACGSLPSSCAMEIDFSAPMSAVNLRLGLDDEQAGEFGAPYQLTGYNSLNNPVAQSNGNATLGSGYSPITTLVSIQSLSTDIAKVVLQLGATNVYPYSTGYASRPGIDDFTFTDNSLPPPAAPSVTISAPSAGQHFLQPGDVRVSGHVSAPAGVSRFCLTTSTASSIPAGCGQADALDSSGNFSNLTVQGIVPGSNTITAWVEDGTLRTASHPVTIDVAQVNLSATNLEVTQAIQSEVPIVAASAGGPRAAAYNGVPLGAGRATVARFWTGVDLGTGPGPLSFTPALLYGYRGGVSLGAPITSIEGTRSLGTTNSVLPPGPTVAQRSDGTSQAFTFRLPPDWTKGTITLEAVVNPGSGAVTECDGCEADNAITLTGVAFTPVRGETISPLEMVTSGAGGSVNHPRADWSGIFTVMPFGVTLNRYRGQIDISDGASVGSRKTRQSMALSKLLDWVDHNGTPPGHLIAMSEGQDLGLTATRLVCCHTHLGIDTVAQVEATRPLTSVAHEFGHEVGLAHAGTHGPLPGDPSKDRACGGDSDGQNGTNWPPDQRGLVAGIGVDPRTGSGGSAATLRVMGLVDGAGNPLNFFDFMSYCASDRAGNAWISVRNWERLLREHATGAAGASSRARSSAPARASVLAPVHGRLGTRPSHGPALRVSAMIGPRGLTRVLGVEPQTGRTIKPDKGSPVTVRVKDRRGHVVSSTRVPVTSGHMDEIADFTLVDAVVPARRGASLQVLNRGRVVGRRARSRHTPRVRLLRPRHRGRRHKKTRVRGRTTLVRWKARDPDSSKLTASIDYSAKGRKYRTLVIGLHGSRYRLPNSLLTRSRQARIRVRVSDGWNVGRAVSAPLRVAKRRVRAVIQEPMPGARIAADGSFVASGAAFGGAGRQLPGSSMRWYDGHRYIGSGRSLTVRHMTPGHRRLRLVALARGRRAVTAVPLRVAATAGR